MSCGNSRERLIAKAKAKAKAELEAREYARSSLIGFTLYTKPDYVVGAMHRQIADALEAIERRDINRLMIFTPPRHGKSELVSRRWPARFLGRFPNKQFIGASYAQSLAGDFGRDVRNIFASDEYRRLYPDVALAADSGAKDKWHTNRGGVYVSAGVGVGITGRGADILSIDDPFKDRQEADSPVIRETVWNWYTSTAFTRLMPGGAVVVTQTRWHEDDLSGRLLNSSNASAWHIINLPAINEAGEPLFPERYPLDALREIETEIGPRDWSALYMQDPRPLDGGLFKTGAIALIDAPPVTEPVAGPSGPTWQQLAGVGTPRPSASILKDGKPVIVRGWDMAATAQFGTNDPDWTVGVKMLRTHDDRFIVLDVIRMRGGPEDVRATILKAAEDDGKAVTVSIAQDPGQAGKWVTADLAKALIGWNVITSPETGDKETRAAPVASQVNVGNVSMLRGAWNRDFIEELRSFPSSRKDDQVDALSRAFNTLTITPAPSRRVNVPIFGR